jgi:PIN domain nuclease of toxin-antitoxin system
LSETATKIIRNTDEQVFISSVSAYEIMNKHRIGKLPEFEDIAENYFTYVEKLKVSALPLNEHHTHHAGKFEWEHRDPFDRLLAAQAHIENMTIITNDAVFRTLPWVKVMW